MAFVKGLLRYGAIKGPVDVFTEWQGTYEAKEVSGPSAVVLGGTKVFNKPIWPMIAGDPQDSLTIAKNYDCKYRKTPFQFLVVPSSVWTDSENDSVTPSDALSFDLGLNIADTATPSDALAFDVATNLADTLSLADNLTPLSAIQPIYFLSLKRYESSQLKGPYLTILGGTFIPPLSITINDSATVADSLAQDQAKLLAETLALADAIAQDLGITIAEAISLADNISTFVPGTTAGSIIYPGSVSGRLSLMKSYFSPQIEGPFEVAFNSLYPTPSFARTANIDDTLDLSDLTEQMRGFPYDEDVLTLADNLSSLLGINRTIADNVALADQIGAGNFVNEALSIADSVGIVKDMAKTISDALSLSDSVEIGGGFTLSQGLIDSLSLADLTTTISAIVRTFADTVSLSDFVETQLSVVGIAISRALTDEVTPFDSVDVLYEPQQFTLNNPVYMGRF